MRSVTAMVIFIALAVLAVVAIGATIYSVSRDGYRRVRTTWR